MNLRQWLFPILLVLPSMAWADTQVFSNFCGINNSVDASVISACQAQDALNVEANKTGSGIKKRDGYGLWATLSTATTSGVTSSFGFKNASGNEILLFTSSSTLFASSNQATPTTVSTITLNARVYCRDNSGVAYCFTSSNDVPFTYDGTTRNEKQASNYPRGAFNDFTQDRQLVSGTTDQANRLYISKSGAFDDFLGGAFDYSSWYEDIGNAGDKITAIYVLNGRPVIFKEFSIGGFNLTDQFNSVYYDICHGIGVVNPQAVSLAAGAAYFKGSDNRFYEIDGTPGRCHDISVDITSTTASLLTGKTRRTILTEKSDWDAGNTVYAGPGAPMSTNITIGSVEPSSVTLVDTSSADFSAGTLGTGVTNYYSPGTLELSTASFIVQNGDFELGTLASWTCSGGGSCSVGTSGCSGTYCVTVQQGCSGVGSGDYAVRIKNQAGAVLYQLAASDDSSILGGKTINLATLGISSQTVYIEFAVNNGVGGETSVFSTTFTAISTVSWTAGGTNGNCLIPTSNVNWAAIDNVKINRLFSTYQSSAVINTILRIFDTGFSTPTGGTFSVSSYTLTSSTLAFQVRSATSSSGNWSTWSGISNGGRITQAKRYWQYSSSFTTTNGTSTVKINDVSLVAATTGQYVTSCIQPGANISAWGILETDTTQDSPGGGFTFYNSTGTNCSDPSLGSNWAVVSTGTTITTTTAAAYKIRVDYIINSGTNTARLNAITVNWTEGQLAPPSYSVFWDNALYWAVANSGSSNNLMLKYDLLNPGWYIFNIPANALLAYNNIFYFGSTSTGKVFKYSNIRAGNGPTSDDGSAINSYWKSKNFSGMDPFVEYGIDKLSLIAKKQSGGTATLTWQSNGGYTASGSYSVTLGVSENVVRNNYSVPFGQRGTFFNYQFGNNSVYPWELLGLKVDLSPRGWRPMP